MTVIAAFLRWWRAPVEPLMTGYQPRDGGRAKSAPRGGSAIPLTTMNIPMPAGAAIPPGSPAVDTTSAVTAALRNAEAVMNDALSLATEHGVEVRGTFFHIGASDKFSRSVTLTATQRLI